MPQSDLYDIPSDLALLIQDRKETVLRACLVPELGFRQVAEVEPLNIPIGASQSKFRRSLLVPNTTPIGPGTFNSDLDNGLTPQERKAEQFTLTPKLYAGTMDLNKLNNVSALVREYLENIYALSQQAETSIDMVARNKLFAEYLGGATFVTAPGTSDTSLAVDDVTGFEYTMVGGVPTPVSGSNMLPITINGSAAAVIGVTVDASNTSRNPYGRSGVLTLASPRVDAAGDIVFADNRPRHVMPFSNGVERNDQLDIVAGDYLTMRQLRVAKTQLRNNNVPMIDGAYNVYLSEDHMEQLFQDDEFQNAFRGTGSTEVYATGTVRRLLDLRFITNNLHQTLAAGSAPTTVARRVALVVGQGALIESDYQNAEELDKAAGGSGLLLHDVRTVQGISFIDRAALDRLGLNMTQSWMWIGDFCVPSDSLITPAVLPTASASRFKRAVAVFNAA